MSLQTRNRCFRKWNPINYFPLIIRPHLRAERKKQHQDITHGAKAIFSRDYRPTYFVKSATCNVVLQTGPTVKALIKWKRARLPASAWAQRHQDVSHTYQHVLSGNRTAFWARTGILACYAHFSFTNTQWSDLESFKLTLNHVMWIYSMREVEKCWNQTQ